jgi:hypothetical protein
MNGTPQRIANGMIIGSNCIPLVLRNVRLESVQASEVFTKETSNVVAATVIKQQMLGPHNLFSSVFCLDKIKIDLFGRTNIRIVFAFYLDSIGLKMTNAEASVFTNP